MKKISFVFLPFLFLLGCHSVSKPVFNSETDATVTVNKNNFILAFGSCNRTEVPNELWDDIVSLQPDVWLWGGDIIYADTDNIEKLQKMYAAQNQVPGYAQLREKTEIIGTWDDHDYGLNDGGAEFKGKEGSQQAFLDFMGVPKQSPRRTQEGVFVSHDYSIDNHKVKVIVLDTRYFRSALKKSATKGRRYDPNTDPSATMLGQKQWQWFEKEMADTETDYFFIMSSIQVGSNQHGFESWGTLPLELERFKKVLGQSQAKGIVVLSGDRHISEFSTIPVNGAKNPVYDFTSSGLTHVYADFSSEYNPHRVGEVVKEKSFGLIELDVANGKMIFTMVGNGSQVLQQREQVYQ